jgi:hypothetical protein
LIGVASAAAGAIYVVVLALAGVQLPDLPAVAASAVSGGVYNAVLAIATYPLCRMARRGTEKQSSFTGQAW